MELIRIFKYIEKLDAFIVSEKYLQIAQRLGLVEWHAVVWIGRLFALDNDYGEHWFDNWEVREALKDEAQEYGVSYDDLLVVVPDRFKNDEDGPCHTAELRKRFWTEVLKGLKLSDEMIFEKARQINKLAKGKYPDKYIIDLEERINDIQKSLKSYQA